MPIAIFLALFSLLLSLTACGSPERSRNSAPVPASGAEIVASAADEALLARADSARIQGADTTRLWVIEVSDYQCPFCLTWHQQTYEQFRREFVDTGRVRFAYLHFPLTQHANAWPAAEASMCAGAQNRFWAMHNSIFATQSRWAGLTDPTAHFESLADAAGVHVPEYRACVANRTMASIVQGDFDRSIEAGVNSTPTFIIGNRMLTGPHPIETFRQVIEGELARLP